MSALLILMAMLVSPPDYTAAWRADTAPTAQEMKLAAHIRRVYPRAPYAELLACRIMREARAFGLDPALLAAIAWTESGYRMHVRGSAGEAGLWQLIPGGWLGPAWEGIRRGQPDYPDRPWRKLSRQTRYRILQSIVVTTRFAAWLVSWHLGFCGAHIPECYARFNSGKAWVHPRYVRRITRRSRAIRKRLRE